MSREVINNSKYKASPKSATVGVKTDNQAAYNEMMAAAATQNISHVKQVLAKLTNQ